MARLGWSLCTILTLLIAGSRRPVVARTVDSGSWWGTKEAHDITHAAEQFRALRNFPAAEAADQRGYTLARERGDDAAATTFLTGVGVARLYQFQYRSALDAFLQARGLAEHAGDQTALGIIAVDLSSLYLQAWDFDSALAEAEQGIERSAAMPRAYCRLPLLLQIGRLHQVLGDGRAAEFFERAIEEARTRAGDAADEVAQEARAWDLLGEERLRQGRIEAAELDFDAAFRLRMAGAAGDLPFSYARLGAVKLALGEWDAAERFTDRALAAQAASQAGLPRYLLVHQRGEIRLARGDTREALSDFETAVDLAGKWRAQVPAAMVSLVAANVALEKRVFRSFIEVAAEEALHTGDTRLAGASFQAAELNRAASLRQGLTFAQGWRDKLPIEYGQTVAELRAREFQNAPAAQTSQLKLALTEMEAKAGPRVSPNEFENFRGRTSLIHFQHGLSSSELFLSFYVGDTGSYLWAVTRNSLSIHRLPGAEEIGSAVRKFRDEIRRAATFNGVTGNGRQTGGVSTGMVAAWFGGLSEQETAKSEWLLSLDGTLFQMPFAALATGERSGRMEYLVEQHSLQVVPGALSLIKDLTGAEDLTGASRGSRGGADGRAGSTRGWFLGLGDPIYNTADPRWRAGHANARYEGWLAFGATGSSSLREWNRLVGSADEVEAGARIWNRGGSESGISGSASSEGAPLEDTRVLTGLNARRDKFLELAAQRPAIIHLATHVLSSQRPAGETSHDFIRDSTQTDAQIVFGLGATGRLEAISASEVGMLHVPGAVVSMTGCESSAGDIRAGAGLLGLTRAWQMAGARAVIATRWPVSDTRGELFEAFYRYLRGVRPAEALRRGQVEMIHSETWRSAPSYWASYQVMGGAH